jgi:protein TonB
VATVSPAPRAPGVPAPAAAAPASRAQLARSATPAPAPAPTPAPDIDAEDPDADPDAEPAAPAAPPAPAPISLPRNVPPNLLESQRIRGNHTIMPDDDEKKAIEAAKEDRVIAAVKLCIDTSGKVSQVKMLRSSGYPGYDRKIRRELKIWEYRPFMLDGKPTAVCTAVSFIYTQK